MRTEEEIRAAIDVAKAAYHDIVDTGNRHEVGAAANEVKLLQQELSDTLAHGAKPCGVCDAPVVCMLKTPEVLDVEGNVKHSAVYETGCPSCIPRARSSSATGAVSRWNADKHLREPFEVRERHRSNLAVLAEAGNEKAAAALAAFPPETIETIVVDV